MTGTVPRTNDGHIQKIKNGPTVYRRSCKSNSQEALNESTARLKYQHRVRAFITDNRVNPIDGAPHPAVPITDATNPTARNWPVGSWLRPVIAEA